MKPRTNKKNIEIYRFSSFFLHSKSRRKKIIVVACAFLLFYGTLLLSNQPGTFSQRVRPSQFKIGEPAIRNVVMDRDITYVDETATALKREAIEQLSYPIFSVKDEITRRVLDSFDRFTELMTEAISAGYTAEKTFLEAQALLPGMLTKEQISVLLSNQRILDILGTCRGVLKHFQENGILPERIPQIKEGTDYIELWRWINGKNEKENIFKGDVVQLSNLKEKAKAYTAGDGNINQKVREILSLLLRIFAVENAFYEEDQTNRNRERSLRDMKPVVRKLVKGEQIVEAGFIVTKEDFEKITALGQYAVSMNIQAVIGNALFLLLILLIALVLLNPPFLDVVLSMEQILVLLAMALFYLAFSVFIGKLFSLPDWLPVSAVFPTALAAMMITILIHYRAGILFTILLSLSTLLYTEMNVYSFLFALASGLAGTLTVRTAEKRIDLIRANFFLALLNAGLLCVFGFFRQYEGLWFLYAAGWGALNGFICGILNLGFLPLIEYVLNAATPFRLIELADINSPTLKKMLAMAPGTYSHSLNVANLAETACREIGANHLLARVGAYYHDIGKMEQAEYFIENQTASNKHDDLKPSLSVAVIKSHVKIGVEKAKELKLPKAVIDIILQHHGSGLISYFYAEALKEQQINSKVQPEHFSYSEPLPSSVEAAVVMLSDTVEAATRTLKKPTVAKLEKYVWGIMKGRFEEGQLNDSNLTFKNLETIKKAFIQVLAGYFHTRIEYPGAAEAAN